MRKSIKTNLKLAKEKRTFVFPVAGGQTGQMIIEADWNEDSIVQIHKWIFLLKSSDKDNPIDWGLFLDPLGVEIGEFYHKVA